MNIGTLIISALVIIICALPFILSSRGSRKRKNAKLKILHTLAEKHQAQISKYDVGADFIIGIDDVKNMVFFFKNTMGTSIENCLNLSDYKDCRLLKFEKNLSSKSGTPAIHTLKLDFIPIDKTTTTSQFEFYNEDVNTQLSGELQLINTWQALIQQKLALK